MRVETVMAVLTKRSCGPATDCWKSALGTGSDRLFPQTRMAYHREEGLATGRSQEPDIEFQACGHCPDLRELSFGVLKKVVT